MHNVDAASRPVVILSCSLNPDSRSHRLALTAEMLLQALGAPVRLIDLADLSLPMCSGAGSFAHPAVKRLTDVIDRAAAILVAAPVYNYDLNAAAKNAMELTGSAWKDKPVGFLCAAGGASSYMAPIGFANSLMFDFRCHIIPRFVYCTGDGFTDGGEPGPEIIRRVEQLVEAAVDLAEALAWMREPDRRGIRAGSGVTP